MFDDADESSPTDLEARLRGLPEVPIPEGLLGRCLATIIRPEDAPAPRGRPIRWAASAAAAVLLLAVAGPLVRPRPSGASEELQGVRAAWSEVPASHRVVRLGRPGERPRAEESWFVRGKGHRKEVRADGKLTALVVDNRRWRFRWDVRAGLASLWSTDLGDAGSPPDEAGLVLESEAFLRWAGAHRAEIRVDPDTLQGRATRKVVLRWPGTPDGAAVPREEALWFDPDSLRPLAQRTVFGDGLVVETTIDYPSPDAVSGDLFAIRPPRDVTLEINDPDLGRQVYSEGRAIAGDPAPRPEKGAER